jgi:hypothetical protein
MAVDGQACTQAAQELHASRSITMPDCAIARAPFEHASIQLRQPMHLVFAQCTCTLGEMLSGL